MAVWFKNVRENKFTERDIPINTNSNSKSSKLIEARTFDCKAVPDGVLRYSLPSMSRFSGARLATRQKFKARVFINANFS
jgi:hypothetical protein